MPIERVDRPGESQEATGRKKTRRRETQALFSTKLHLEQESTLQQWPPMERSPMEMSLFFSAQRLLASARSFNTLDCMLHIG